MESLLIKNISYIQQTSMIPRIASRCILYLIYLGLISGCSQPVQMPQHIDHLVYTAPSLEEGITQIESIFGITPIVGGQHPQYGTHNALLSLGDSTYLEIIAPDPALSLPVKGILFGDRFNQKPGLATWVLRTDEIEQLQSRATRNGLALGTVEEGRRDKPDGTTLTWKLTNPYAFPYNGTIPFLISWGDSPHPAKALPKAGELVGLEIYHPNPDEVNEALQHLDVHLNIIPSDRPSLIALIKTKEGIIRLE